MRFRSPCTHQVSECRGNNLSPCERAGIYLRSQRNRRRHWPPSWRPAPGSEQNPNIPRSTSHRRATTVWQAQTSRCPAKGPRPLYHPGTSSFPSLAYCLHSNSRHTVRPHPIRRCRIRACSYHPLPYHRRIHNCHRNHLHVHGDTTQYMYNYREFCTMVLSQRAM